MYKKLVPYFQHLSSQFLLLVFHTTCKKFYNLHILLLLDKVSIYVLNSFLMNSVSFCRVIDENRRIRRKYQQMKKEYDDKVFSVDLFLSITIEW